MLLPLSAFSRDFIRIPTLVAEQVISSLAPPRVQQEEQEHRQQQAEHRQQQAYLHNFTDIPQIDLFFSR